MCIRDRPNIALLPPEEPWSPEDVLAALREAGSLPRDGASRLLFLRADTAAAADLLFANGDCHGLPSGRTGFLSALCRRPALAWDAVAPWLSDPACVALLTRLFNAGHFLPPDDGVAD